MGIEIPLWSCFVLIARIYSPFVLFLFQSFLSVITEARFYSLEATIAYLRVRTALPC